eukprot:TRINITY_DN103184_c0_g1_i1.p1 TRINITY_DN103184_c0_g1~~TRINITY_DN103184_c0_g1_i1.p1  ORF type:complete len:561 (-),score=95.79 TRINITY_DN103184_c0_g1_i1:454-2031(-)
MGGITSKREYTKFSQARNFTVLLLGQTGSGKTSFLNFIAGFQHGLPALFGKDLSTKEFLAFWDARISDPSLENAKEDAMASKTSDARTYQLSLASNWFITIIDTPGFGDSRGLAEDKQHTTRIMDCMKTVNSVDCVLLVINGRESRMNPTLKYVLSQLTSIMPKAVLTQLVIVFTNAADEDDKNFDEHSLREVGIGDPRFCCLDNPLGKIEKLIKESTVTDRRRGKLSREIQGTMKSLEDLFWIAHEFKPIPSIRFTELNEKRESLEASLANMIQRSAETSGEIRALEAHLAQMRHAGSGQPLTRQVRRLRLKQLKFKWNRYVCHHLECYCNCADSNVPFPFASIWRSLNSAGNCESCNHVYGDHLVSRNGWESEMVTETTQFALNLEEAIQQLDTKKAEVAAEQAALALEVELKIEEYHALGLREAYVRLLRSQKSLIQHQCESNPDDILARNLLDLVCGHLDAIEKAAESLCCICSDAMPNTQLLPCGHSKFCFSCGEQCGTCPICRKLVSSRKLLFAIDSPV